MAVSGRGPPHRETGPCPARPEEVAPAALSPGQEAAPHPCLPATLSHHPLLCHGLSPPTVTLPPHSLPHPARCRLPRFTPTSFLSVSGNPLHFNGFIAGSYKKAKQTEI